MENKKLREIIQDKNERLERDTLRTAEIIIEGIVQEQKRIRDAQERIKELRAELVSLEVKELDPSVILGED